jgi:hypothetical protein
VDAHFILGSADTFYACSKKIIAKACPGNNFFDFPS